MMTADGTRITDVCWHIDAIQRIIRHTAPAAPKYEALSKSQFLLAKFYPFGSWLKSFIGINLCTLE